MSTTFGHSYRPHHLAERWNDEMWNLEISGGSKRQISYRGRSEFELISIASELTKNHILWRIRSTHFHRSILSIQSFKKVFWNCWELDFGRCKGPGWVGSGEGKALHDWKRCGSCRAATEILNSPSWSPSINEGFNSFRDENSIDIHPFSVRARGRKDEKLVRRTYVIYLLKNIWVDPATRIALTPPIIVGSVSNRVHHTQLESGQALGCQNSSARVCSPVYWLLTRWSKKRCAVLQFGACRGSSWTQSSIF